VKRLALCLGLSAALAAAGGRIARAADEPPANEELVTLILGLVGEQDKELRAVGLDQIRTDAKGAAATKRFADQLPKLSPDAQASLLSALADRGDVTARAAVIALLGSTKQDEVKIAAVGALGALGDAQDLPLLLPILSSTDKDELSAGKSALMRLRGASVPAALAAKLKSSTDIPVRVALIEVLTQRRAPETYPDLVAAAADANGSVRSAAINALAQLGGVDQIAGMLTGVLKADKGAERDAAERAIEKVCSRIPQADQRSVLVLAAIDKFPASDRALLLPTLGRVGGPAALQAVEAAIADPALHDAGLKALGNWPDASVAPQLLEVFKADAHPEHRNAALGALIRVAPLKDKRTDSDRLMLLKDVMQLCTKVDDQNKVLTRASAIYTVDSLRFVAPYLDQPQHAQQACEAVVELAHHRDIRDANRADFMPALDKVIAISKDPVARDRAERYKAGKTWVKQ
jgi:HEAT repeat protein